MTIAFLKGIIDGVRAAGHAINCLINTVLLTIVYVFGVGLTFMIARITRRKLLDLHDNEHQQSYWKDSDLKRKPFDEYYRQF